MNPNIKTTNTVTPTIADTLSDSEEQELRQAVEHYDVQHNIKDYHDETLDNKGSEFANRLQQSTVVRHIKSHPLQSVGMALIGGIFIGSVFSRR